MLARHLVRQAPPFSLSRILFLTTVIHSIIHSSTVFNAMYSKIFLLWLLPTTLAAPMTDPISPGHTLQKRSITCTPTYGTRIDLQHCKDALQQVPDTVIGEDIRFTMNGPSGMALMGGPFSNTATRPRYKLPQYFGSETSCTLGVSLHNPDATVKFNWDALKRELSRIIDQCIAGQDGQGGSSNTYADLFDIAIWAEPLTDLEESPEAYCARRPKTNLLGCLTSCFSGGCRRTSPGLSLSPKPTSAATS